MTATAQIRLSETALRELLLRLRCGTPMRQEALVSVPLFDPGHGREPEIDRPGSTLGMHGTVHPWEVVVHNQGARPCLMLEGDELAGELPGRVLKGSALVPQGLALRVPVSRGERGPGPAAPRSVGGPAPAWEHQGGQAEGLGPGGGGPAPARDHRGSQAEGLGPSGGGPALAREHQGSQAEGLHPSAGGPAPAGDHRGSHTEGLHASGEGSAREPLDGQVGLAACLGRRRVAFVVVAHPSLYGPVHDRVVRAFAGEARASGERAPAPFEAVAGVQRFLADLARRRFRTFPGMGLGKDLRLQEVGGLAQALVWRGRVLSASASWEV